LFLTPILATGLLLLCDEYDECDPDSLLSIAVVIVMVVFATYKVISASSHTSHISHAAHVLLYRFYPISGTTGLSLTVTIWQWFRNLLSIWTLFNILNIRQLEKHDADMQIKIEELEELNQSLRQRDKEKDYAIIPLSDQLCIIN